MDAAILHKAKKIHAKMCCMGRKRERGEKRGQKEEKATLIFPTHCCTYVRHTASFCEGGIGDFFTYSITYCVLYQVLQKRFRNYVRWQKVISYVQCEITNTIVCTEPYSNFEMSIYRVQCSTCIKRDISSY